MIKEYEINSGNLLAHELIGLKVEVIDSSDESRKGLKGKIVNETKNTFCIESQSIGKIVPKKEAVFRFYLEKEKVEVHGKMLLEKPENRIKVFWRKYHGKMQ